MIRVAPYEGLAAKAVLDRLDPADLLECQLIAGQPLSGLEIWAEWRAMQPNCYLSCIAHDGATPFAVLALCRTGQAGVAGASLLACDHRRYRRQIVALLREARDRLPKVAAEAGLHRIEARSWADHPRAAGLLRALGFGPEALMRGFGLTGAVSFTQWAWLAEDRQSRTCPMPACPSPQPEQ